MDMTLQNLEIIGSSKGLLSIRYQVITEINAERSSIRTLSQLESDFIKDKIRKAIFAKLSLLYQGTNKLMKFLFPLETKLPSTIILIHFLRTKGYVSGPSFPNRV